LAKGGTHVRYRFEERPFKNGVSDKKGCLAKKKCGGEKKKKNRLLKKSSEILECPVKRRADAEGKECVG